MSKKNTNTPKNDSVDELCEDMEVVGPGQMLAEARKKLALSVEDVANKLKFRKTLVENIEQDMLDQSLPTTYNRGYLRSYAKLVNIDVNEVLSAYDMLGVAELQRSEMQSFSNLTEKQAEHSRIMWFSYLIVAVLIGLMVLWWFQAPKFVVGDNSPTTSTQVELGLSDTNTQIKEVPSESSAINNTQLSADNPAQALKTASPNTDVVVEKVTEQQTPKTATTTAPNIDTLTQVTAKNTLAETPVPEASISTAVFTFSGDCWVNIYDASGERIAWGVKKSGYVMTITGEPPLKVTLGRPELADIVFNGQAVDISHFSAGNIAKFTLPINL